jgi:hypothetical protein
MTTNRQFLLFHLICPKQPQDKTAISSQIEINLDSHRIVRMSKMSGRKIIGLENTPTSVF